MIELKRTAGAVWRGDLKHGEGTMSSPAGTFRDLDYRAASRFENEPGANPEEMIGAAHAACFSMQLSHLIASSGSDVESVETKATVTLDMSGDSPQISRVHLETEGKVSGMNEEEFRRIAQEAKETCPVSKLLMPGLGEMTMEAHLKAN